MFPQWGYGAKRIKPEIVGKPIVFGKMTFLYTYLVGPWDYSSG